MSNTPNMAMPEIAESQSGKYITHNEALKYVDVHLQGSVISATTSAQPGSPAEGDRYIMPSGTLTGADWSGYSADDFVIYYGGAWANFTPVEGWSFWINDTDKRVTFDGTNWLDAAAGTVTRQVDIQPAGLGKPGANPMTSSTLGVFPTLLADDTTEESSYFSFDVPTDWKSGTDITLHIHYMNVSAQTGTNSVIFGIEYAAVADDEDGTPGTTYTSEVTDTLANNEVAEVSHETSPMTISNANIAAEDNIGVRFYRKAADASDTMTGDAAICGFHLEYTAIA